MNNPPAGDANKWAGLLLTEALAGLYRYGLKEMRGQMTAKMQSDLQLVRGQKTSSFKVTLSKARAFLKDSRTKLVVRMKEGFGVLLKKEGDYLESAVRVEKALMGVEAGLCQIMPDFSQVENERWPGPIGYRVALNHFVAVSLRLHSIFPKVEYDGLISLVGRVVLTPIMAHNLTFLLRSDPSVFRVIAVDGRARDDDPPSKSLLAWYASGAPSKPEELGAARGYAKPTSLSTSEMEKLQRWQLLFDALIHFHPVRSQANEQFTLIRELVTEYVENPAISRLWSSLADLASGDLSADEMLVAKVIQQDELTFKKTEQLPLVNCARAKFGLLRFAFKMEAEAEMLRKNPDGALDTAEKVIDAHKAYPYPDHTDHDQASKLFGWAYLLSRRILLGRMVKGNPAHGLSADLKNAAVVLKLEWRASELLDRLLESLSRPEILKAASKARQFGLLAIRYRAGLRSNPRFIIDVRGKPGTSYIEEAIAWLKKDDALDIPKGIVWMLMARNALHNAWHCQNVPQKYIVQLDQALSHYARTLDAIFDSKVKFEEDISVKNDEGTMDGEVAAWCIPEMAAALWMKERATEDKKAKLQIARYRKALITAGEIQFGIYFNFDLELERIITGLRIRCDLRR
ncbi:hypothetical protein EMGBS10_10180 [Opitutia bacterium]|nr:hypothetical protein EMGBS10_10180 [Opitutae bacterium]